MKDLVIGSITNYDYPQIKYWVNSIERSGFSGDKVMLCYNISYSTADELRSRGYELITFDKNDSANRYEYNKKNFCIMLERFIHMWYFLRQRKGQYRYLITTDVKDVVFQRNPSEWLEANLGGKKINAACESIRYKDEWWGNNNLMQAFGPTVYEVNKDNLIYNAGVQSGEFDTMVDLFFSIAISCSGSPAFVPGGGGPDQAAYNILLQLEPYKSITRFSSSEDGWAAQLGTSKVDGFKNLIVEPQPIIVDGVVCTSKGIPFSIVHQYDRISEWKDTIERKYS